MSARCKPNLRLVEASAETPANVARQGFSFIYRQGERNFCPDCGRGHWHIGRSTAECAFCATAVPLGGV